jgi:hypothetical protein
LFGEYEAHDGKNVPVWFGEPSGPDNIGLAQTHCPLGGSAMMTSELPET